MILCINICNFNNFICPVSKDQLFKIIVWRNARKWSLRWCRRCVHTCRSSCGQHILRGSIKSLETGLRRSRLIWLVVFLEHDWIMFPLILGMSSSQLTNSYFSEGFGSTTSSACRMERCGLWPLSALLRRSGMKNTGFRRFHRFLMIFLMVF